MNTPVLLIAWRRSDTLRQLIDAIRPVAPTRLFVACDGPNPNRLGEVEKVEATRDVIAKEIDWPCRIERLYSDVNQGCRIGPIRAITWFFDHVDEGIILEDDCIPHIAFFDYCEWALTAYKHEKSVMHINGNNFSASSSFFDDELSFVSLPQVWGWATWSDRWDFFEGNPFYLDRNVFLKNWSISNIAKISKLKHLHALKKGLDAWDYQWQITVLNRRGLSVCPRNNLIPDVGVGVDATHTCNDTSRTFLKTGGFERPKNPPPIQNNVQLTKYFEKQMQLTFHPKLIIWFCASLIYKFRCLLKYALIFLVFGKYIPVVISSTGRAGSTMLANSIAASFSQAKYSFLPTFLKRQLARISLSYFDRLEDIGLLRRAPVIKTHDLYRSDINKNVKYVFVYGDPLDSAVSALRQSQLRGSVWLDKHIFHLCGKGTPDQVLVNDVLNYEKQLSSWEVSPAFFVHYSEIWNNKDKLSEFLGFPLLLPAQRPRSSQDPAYSVLINHLLFDRLKVIQKCFRNNVSGH